MRGMRGALWALGLAGAAYAWKNRGKLQQQVNSLSSQTAPNQLPDYGSHTSNQYAGSGQDTATEGQGEPANIRPGTALRGSDV